MDNNENQRYRYNRQGYLSNDPRNGYAKPFDPNGSDPTSMYLPGYLEHAAPVEYDNPAYQWKYPNPMQFIIGILKVLLAVQFMDEFVLPIIGDFTVEFKDALEKGKRFKAACVCLEYAVQLAIAIGLYVFMKVLAKFSRKPSGPA